MWYVESRRLEVRCGLKVKPKEAKGKTEDKTKGKAESKAEGETEDKVEAVARQRVAVA